MTDKQTIEEDLAQGFVVIMFMGLFFYFISFVFYIEYTPCSVYGEVTTHCQEPDMSHCEGKDICGGGLACSSTCVRNRLNDLTLGAIQ